jgi:hypothetical protein
VNQEQRERRDNASEQEGEWKGMRRSDREFQPTQESITQAEKGDGRDKEKRDGRNVDAAFDRMHPENERGRTEQATQDGEGIEAKVPSPCTYAHIDPVTLAEAYKQSGA